MKLKQLIHWTGKGTDRFPVPQAAYYGQFSGQKSSTQRSRDVRWIQATSIFDPILCAPEASRGVSR
jgi:hypothetical protein